MNLLSRGKGPPHVTHRDSRTFRVITITTTWLVRTRPGSRVHSLSAPYTLLAIILLHNTRKKAPHDRRHGRGLKRPIPASVTSRSHMRLEATLNLCPTSLLTAAGEGSSPKLDSGTTPTTSPIGLGPTAEFRMSRNHCRGCIMVNRAMTPNETVSLRQFSTPWIPNYLASRPLHYSISAHCRSMA